MMATLPTYASCKPDPGATYTDAMTIDWSLLKGYAFQVTPVLEKSISGLCRSSPSVGPSMAGATFVASPPEPFN